MKEIVKAKNKTHSGYWDHKPEDWKGTRDEYERNHVFCMGVERTRGDYPTIRWAKGVSEKFTTFVTAPTFVTL